MKKGIALLIAAIMMLSVSLAMADTRITVSGTGETQVSADNAIVSLGVCARDKDVLKAQQKVNESIAAIRQALIDLGVKEEYINTDYMNIYAIYDYGSSFDYDGPEQVTAYNANSTLAVKVTDMELVGKVIDSAFAAGANTLNGISFSASNTEEAEAESLKKAVADAKAKAEVLAEATGLKIKGIEILSEGGVYSYDNGAGNFSAKAMGAVEAEEAFDGSTVVQAAKLIVNATVTITFEAE